MLATTMSSLNPSMYGFRLAVLEIVLALCSCSLVCGRTHPFDRVQVQVHNFLAPNHKLNIHCKSKDNDLGFHPLAYHQYFSWHFNVNFGRSTLFWFHKIVLQRKKIPAMAFENSKPAGLFSMQDEAMYVARKEELSSYTLV
ncbi:hypothetical protein FRX31_010599 [Thalictrum thalictroides]|uniref:S-protein homolog n=1 Tax=Thalictrum thalictroides TaxID=46969 RepID=A0A7J6WSK1_THATH|nr:hypothetical protein FRX31_010599 [Thalictrum thalictroides]